MSFVIDIFFLMRLNHIYIKSYLLEFINYIHIFSSGRHSMKISYNGMGYCTAVEYIQLAGTRTVASILCNKEWNPR